MALLFGKTKYSFGKMTKLALKGITSFSSKPLRIAILIGSIISLENKIKLTFEPQKVKIAMAISLIIFCSIVLLLLYNPKFIRRSLSPS
jgi:ABC-type sugar transport system permease subunit